MKEKRIVQLTTSNSEQKLFVKKIILAAGSMSQLKGIKKN